MKLPLENIQSVIRCPICNKKYRSSKILVLDEDEKRNTLHMACVECGAATIFFVSLGQFGIVSLGTLTDLEQSEAKGVFQGEAVSPDNVLEAHQFFKHSTGDIEAFLQE